MAEAVQIRVVLFKEGDLWVGQCLEYDIGAQATDLDQLHARLLIALDCERKESIERKGAPFAGIDPAPRHFFEKWERASGKYDPRRQSGGALNLDLALCA